jgi:rsbT co-antagonist protein RsbR
LNERSLFPQLLLEYNHTLAEAQDRLGIAQALCRSIAACADHSTVFMYQYHRADNTVPYMVEVTDTQDQSGQELMPLASRYLWADFPLQAIVPDTGVAWLTLDMETPLEVSALLVDTLHLSCAAMVSLVSQGCCIGCLLAGWRETPPPDGFAPFVEAVAVQAASRLCLYQELEETQRALENALVNVEEASVFASLVENAGDAIDIVDLDGFPFYMNAAYLAMYGFESTHEAMAVDPLSLTAPRDRERFEQVCFPQAKAGMWSGNLQRLRQGERASDDNAMFIAEVTMFGVQNSEGTLVGVATIAHDISEHLQLRESLREQARLRQELIAAQQNLIHKLSTPLIPVTDDILVMPLVGSIDAQRAKDIMRGLLAGIDQHRATVVILDITGVSEVDSEIVDYLNKTMRAARLKGAHTVVTGVSELVAETIVDLGLDWGDITSLPDLQAGIRYALRQMKKQIK